MPSTSVLTATVTVQKRGVLGRLIRLPQAFWRHYRVARRANGRIVSAYVAWLMAGLIIKVH
jgi:hypothetical protein